MENLPESVTDLLKKIEEIEYFKKKILSFDFMQDAINDEIKDVADERDKIFNEYEKEKKKFFSEKRELLLRINEVNDNLNKKIKEGIAKKIKNEKNSIFKTNEYNHRENVKLRKINKELSRELQAFRKFNSAIAK